MGGNGVSERGREQGDRGARVGGVGWRGEFTAFEGEWPQAGWRMGEKNGREKGGGGEAVRLPSNPEVTHLHVRGGALINPKPYTPLTFAPMASGVTLHFFTHSPPHTPLRP